MLNNFAGYIESIIYAKVMQSCRLLLTFPYAKGYIVI